MKEAAAATQKHLYILYSPPNSVRSYVYRLNVIVFQLKRCISITISVHRCRSSQNKVLQHGNYVWRISAGYVMSCHVKLFYWLRHIMCIYKVCVCACVVKMKKLAFIFLHRNSLLFHPHIPVMLYTSTANFGYLL